MTLATLPRRLLPWILGALLAASGAAPAQEKAQDKGAGFQDAVITELVTSALINDPILRKVHISVETLDRVVHLRGLVDSMAQVNRAETVARGIDGVNAVRNAIRVTNRPSRA
jgi:hyperosmotically inducible periplasmic protein